MRVRPFPNALFRLVYEQPQLEQTAWKTANQPRWRETKTNSVMSMITTKCVRVVRDDAGWATGGTKCLVLNRTIDSSETPSVHQKQIGQISNSQPWFICIYLVNMNPEPKVMGQTLGCLGPALLLMRFGFRRICEFRHVASEFQKIEHNKQQPCYLLSV